MFETKKNECNLFNKKRRNNNEEDVSGLSERTARNYL